MLLFFNVGVKTIGGTVSFNDNAAIVYFSLPTETIGYSLYVERNSKLESFDFPYLGLVSGPELRISNNSQLYAASFNRSVQLPSNRQCVGNRPTFFATRNPNCVFSEESVVLTLSVASIVIIVVVGVFALIAFSFVVSMAFLSKKITKSTSQNI